MTVREETPKRAAKEGQEGLYKPSQLFKDSGGLSGDGGEEWTSTS